MLGCALCVGVCVCACSRICGSPPIPSACKNSQAQHTVVQVSKCPSAGGGHGVWLQWIPQHARMIRQRKQDWENDCLFVGAPDAPCLIPPLQRREGGWERRDPRHRSISPSGGCRQLSGWTRRTWAEDGTCGERASARKDSDSTVPVSRRESVSHPNSG